MSTLQNQGCKMSFLQSKYQETSPIKETLQVGGKPRTELKSSSRQISVSWARTWRRRKWAVKVGSQQTEAEHRF